jgi:tetratricopeptide (TPR) repeat protein
MSLGEPGEPAGQATCSPEVGCIDDLAAAQAFDLAERYAASGDIRRADETLRDLARHRIPQIRLEALFRLAMLLANGGRPKQAAVLLRRILDEEPAAGRVRLELAQLLDRIGDDSGARKALREAQAGGLPPAVALLVDRYSAALRARKPAGATIEVALAPDSNINAATRSDSLGTVFGDFTLDPDARQTSGVGLAVRGQAHRRQRLSDSANLLARIAGSADLYRPTQYNDVVIGLSAGPELAVGAGRLNGEIGAIMRWYGNDPLSRTAYLSATYLHPIDRRSQVRAGGAAGAIDNRLNDLQDGRSYGASLSYERALSARAGAGFTLSGERQKLRDGGYSTTSAQLSVFAYRDFGAATITATLSYRRLQADERLFLYPARRKENFHRASVGVTVRKLAVAEFAPVVRVTAERNRSSLELFDYRRVRTEVGIARAF